MAKPLGSMFIELGLDTSKFNPGLQSAKRAVNYFQAETRGLDAALKNNGKNVDALGAKHRSLTQAVEAQKSVLSQLKSAFDSLKPGTAKWEAAAVEIERHNAKLAGMEGQLAQVADSLKRVHAESSRWGKVSTAFDAVGEKAVLAGQRLRQMGDAMMPVSTLLTAGFTLATKKAIDFEGQMQVTKALLADTAGSAAELDSTVNRLGDSSKKWAREYGISTSSINEGMQEIIKKGFDFNQTVDAMPSILSASKAAGEDFNTVMNASTNILQQFGLEAKDTERVTDSLTFVANKTAAGFADMGNAMEYVGPVAKNIGMSLEDTAAAVGLLSNNGIAGEKAGTALRGALTRLLKPSDQNAIAMEKLGFTTEEFRSGAIGLPDILDRIKQSTQGMTEAQRTALIAQAFGTEAQTAMNILVDQGSENLRKLASETNNAKGYTKNLAKEMMQSGKSGVDRFKSSLEVLQITIGQKLLPTITPFVEWLTKIVTTFAEADPYVQKFWTGLGLGAAIAYPALNFVGNFLTATGHVSKVLSTLTGRWASAKAGIEGIGLASSVSNGSVGALASNGGMLGAILSPTGLLVAGGLATAAVLTYFGVQALEASHRTQKWGTDVNAVQANELEAFKLKVEDTQKAMVDFASGAVEDVEEVRTAFQGLVNEIKVLSDEELAKDLEIADKLGLSEEVKAAITASSQQVVSNAQHMSDEVIAIYQRHNNDINDLTAEEQAIVLNNQNQLIEAQLGLMGYSHSEMIAIRKAMNGDLSEMNLAQKSEWLGTIQSWVAEEKKLYDEQKKNLESVRESIIGTDEKALRAREEINKKLQALESDHSAKMDGYQSKQIEALRAWYLEQTEVYQRLGNTEAIEANKKSIESYLASIGMTYEEFMNVSEQAANSSNTTSNLIAQDMQNMSEATKRANDMWKGMVFDEKTGMVKTNAAEEVQKAIQSKEGWNQLMFVVKEAKLTTDAKELIAGVIQEAGRWDELTLMEKTLLVNNVNAQMAINDSIGTLTGWNMMTPQEKALWASNQTHEGVAAAQATINGLTGTTASIVAADNTSTGIEAANTSITTFTSQPATKYIDMIMRETFQRNEKGTNYHPGGMAMVNDQRGVMYKELITLPSGHSFIPEGRNVLLPLPRGSKVLNAGRTKRLMDRLGIPKYAKGVGIPEDSRILKEMTSVTVSKNQIEGPSYTPEVVTLLKAILSAITTQSRLSQTSDVYLDLEKVGNMITQAQEERRRTRSMLEGVMP